MKKLNLIIILLPIIFFCSFLLRYDMFTNKPKNYDFNPINQVLPSDIDIADEWYRTYGSSREEIGYAVAISSTTQNIFISGTDILTGDVSGWSIIYCDRNGYSFGGRGMYDLFQDIRPYAAESDSSGNVIIGGEYFQYVNGLYFMELWKLNSTGGMVWGRRWGGTLDAKCYGLTTDQEDNIYIVGEIESPSAGKSDFILVKYNSSGDEEWNRVWGGDSFDQCNDVAIDSSGNIYIAGTTWSYGLGMSEMCLVKFNSTGDYQWNKTFGGPESDYCTSIGLDLSGNIYLGGHSTSFLSGFPMFPDICLVKFNSSGAYQWHQTWGEGNGIDKCFDLELDTFGNIFLAGETTSYKSYSLDMCLIKYNSSGARLWNSTWGGDYSDSCYGITKDSIGNLYLVGFTQSFGYGGSDMCLVKYSTKPKVTIVSPHANEYFGSTAPNFELSIFEPDLSNMWYTIDNGNTNTSCSLTGQIQQFLWNQKSDGSFPVRFYAKDTEGNEAFSEVYINKDTSPPNLWLILPEPNTRFITNPPSLIIRAVDAYLNSCWYNIDNGIQDYTIDIIDPVDYNELWEQINLNVWNQLPDGRHTITVYVKDAAGNIASESIIIYKGVEEIIYGYNIFILLAIFGIAIYTIRLRQRSVKQN